MFWKKGFIGRFLLLMHVMWLLARDKDSIEARVNHKTLRGLMSDEDVQVFVC